MGNSYIRTKDQINLSIKNTNTKIDFLQQNQELTNLVIKMQNLPLPQIPALRHRMSSNISQSLLQQNNQKQAQFKLLQKNKKSKRRYNKKQKSLTQQQIQVFRQAFQIFDSNHSGSIDQGQLKSLMSALGFDYDDEQIITILQQIDEDGSGVIEIDQFVQFMSKHMLDTQNLKKQIRKVFKHFDDDNSGYLDFRKLKTMTIECFYNLDDDAITNMIKAADTQGDGKINQYEFFRIMKKVKLI